MTSAKPPRTKFRWLRSSLSSIGSSGSSANSTRSSTASSSSSSSEHGAADGALASPMYKPRVEYELGKLLREVMGMDSNWVSEEQVEHHYERLGWRVTSIEKDGNCLFRAISDQLYGSERFHQDIRQRLVDFIAREKDIFAPFVELEGESMDAYCTRMRRSGEWGGNPELYAAAKSFNIHLVVHQGPLRRLRIENDDPSDPTSQNKGLPPPPAKPYRTLHLLFKDEHYRSLRPKDGTDPVDDPLCGSTATVDSNSTDTTSADPQSEPAPVQAGGIAEETDEQVQAEQDERQRGSSSDSLPGVQFVSETAELPQCGVWIPRRVVFRRGRRRRSSAVLSLMHMPSMDHLALSVTTEIEFDEADMAATAGRTEAAEPQAAEPQSDDEPAIPPERRQRQEKSVMRTVPIVYPRRTRFHKGRPLEAAC